MAHEPVLSSFRGVMLWDVIKSEVSSQSSCSRCTAGDVILEVGW